MFTFLTISLTSRTFSPMDGATSKPKSLLSKKRIVWLTATLVVFGTALLYPTILYHLGHVITDDAYVSGNLVTISSQISARVDSMATSTGDTVSVGQILVVLDDRPFHANLNKARAVETSARSQLAEAQITLEREKHRAGPLADQYAAEWVATKARLNAARAAYEQAKRSLARAERLSGSGLISESELESTRIAAQQREAELEEAGEQVNKAAAGVKMTDGHLHPVRIQHQKVETARARLTLAETDVERARISLLETRIFSPVRGIVAKSAINTGELVDVGQTLAFVHDLDTLWVIANVEETLISRVKMGQSVSITIDAWPDLPLEGRVEKIGSVTGSQFAMIPRESLGGNFVKVVQRIPIRISVRDPGRLLQLGLSAVVGIDIR
ncbi:MAG: HlyD family secretion protein [Candidatus Latescibacterota bacterium]|nr:HlyD family secretion protein [Candidatus Latescibacterota bacterium]